jgi:hypothetical protein
MLRAVMPRKTPSTATQNVPNDDTLSAKIAAKGRAKRAAGQTAQSGQSAVKASDGKISAPITLSPSEREFAALLSQIGGRKTSKKRTFLTALARFGVVSPAAIEAGLSRKELDLLREQDDVFREAWDMAGEVANDLLEAEYRRRSFHGVQRPLVSVGKVVTDQKGNPIYITEYSDRGAEFLLKGRRAAIFRDSLTHRGDPTQPIFIRTDKEDSAL